MKVHLLPSMQGSTHYTHHNSHISATNDAQQPWGDEAPTTPEQMRSGLGAKEPHGFLLDQFPSYLGKPEEFWRGNIIS